jgi:peptidoglycan/LPS O-acetylase OafA/YrhL
MRQYRADIDGLRALAIISVVFWHYGVPGFKGGFVGVDVFFVISGFLITRIVVDQIRDGTFTFARFFERRARRLLPTLTVVLAATLAAGMLLMTPQDFAELCKSALYALVFAANFYFADQGGYFGSTLELAPLVHLWSLAVEEQFYIVWPLVCALALRFSPRPLFVAAVLLLVASFVTNLSLVASQPQITFFHPYTRIWEPLAGCLIALSAPRASPLNAVVGPVGLLLIVAAVVGLDDATPYPGAAALMPVLGSALVIWSGISQPSLVGRILSLRPLVFVGLVSYAWYLWHWPAVVFFRYHTERDPTGLEVIALVVISFTLAALSWRFIEQPVRRATWWPRRSRLVAAAGTAVLSLGAFAGIAYTSDGLITRYPTAIQEMARKRVPDASGCPVSSDPICRLHASSTDGARNVLLWGDSHASILRDLFRDLGQAHDASIAIAAAGGCPPLIGAGRSGASRWRDKCKDRNDTVGARLMTDRYSDVVLVARWDYYAVGNQPVSGISRKLHYLRDADSPSSSLEENRAVLTRALKRTVDAIVATGARPWIVLEVPYAGFDVPNRAARTIMAKGGVQTLLGLSASELQARGDFMRTLASRLPVRVIDPAEALSDGEHGVALADGRPLYFDDNHLSVYGVDRVRPLFEPIFLTTMTHR